MKLNKHIDHTLLKPEATEEQILKLCDEALEYDFYSVCVNSCYVPLAVDKLSGSDVKVAAVAGFPLGAMSTASKVFEAREAVEAGADFVKTSTGFSTGGATSEDVALMRETVGNKAKVKASGGIRTLADAEKFVELGADRLGCSAGVQIMKEYK